MKPVPPGSQLAHEIADLARAEGLVLFLGAGVNGKAGLLWGGLLKKLLARGLEWGMESPPSARVRNKIVAKIVADHDFYARASLGSMLLGTRRFVPILQSLLYGRLHGSCDLSRLEALCRAAARRPMVWIDRLGPRRLQEAFGFLAALARLCMRPEVVAVVTYNYDTLLEFAMESMVRDPERAPGMDRTPVPIARQVKVQNLPARGARLDVYHVHGCLPPPGGLTHLTDYPVVLGQEEYARSMQDPYSWEGSSQLHFLRSFPCLFLGLSMSDWNMLRLLRSAMVGDEPGGRLHCVGDSPQRLQRDLRARLLARVGVHYHAAVGRQPFAQIRSFADQLFFELRKKPKERHEHVS